LNDRTCSAGVDPRPCRGRFDELALEPLTDRDRDEAVARSEVAVDRRWTHRSGRDGTELDGVVPAFAREVEHSRQHPSSPGGLGALEATAWHRLFCHRVRHRRSLLYQDTVLFRNKVATMGESALRSPSRRPRCHRMGLELLPRRGPIRRLFVRGARVRGSTALGGRRTKQVHWLRDPRRVPDHKGEAR
jgi:hypothetical protein